MHELDEDLTYGMLKVNVEGTVRMTRAVAPFMMERRKGAILNISSGSGNHPTPMISVYAATKVREDDYYYYYYYYYYLLVPAIVRVLHHHHHHH